METKRHLLMDVPFFVSIPTLHGFAEFYKIVGAKNHVAKDHFFKKDVLLWDAKRRSPR